MKQININDKLYDLAAKYPDIIDIMDSLGFHEIKIPGMIQTAGRMVTIPDGARMKHIEWNKIVQVFADNGFKFINEEN